MNLNDFVVIPNKPKSVKLNARNLRELRMETVTLAQQSKDMEECLLRLKESMSREKEERVRSGRSRWRSGQALSDSSTKNKENKFQKLSAGRVKITVLKDEPHAEEVRGGVERALPPASSGQLSSRKSRLTGKACGQCEAKMAGLMCAECGEDYCVGCFARFHQKGALKLHRMIPFQSEIHTSVSMLDVVNRFQRQVHPDPDPSPNPNPYKIPGPGAQTAVSGGEQSRHNKTQAPPITTRSQHAKVLFLNVGREEGEEDDDEEEEEEEEGSGSFLLEGEYDEKESSRSFQEALREWRGGRREGGERKEGGEAVWRLVTSQPGTAVRGTQAGLGGPDEGSPNGGPPIRVEFQQYSLSYLDRLLLKKHRRTPIEAYQPLYPPSLPPTLTHSEGEMTPSLTVEEVELRRYCASLFSVASGSPPPERAPSGAWLSIQELDETSGGGVRKEVFAEEEEDESTLFTLPPQEGTTLNATLSPQPIHSTPRSPQPIHSTTRSPQPIHSTPRSPQPIHSTPRSPQSPSQLTARSKPKAKPSADFQLSPVLGGSPRKSKTSACLPASPGVCSSISARRSNAPSVSPSSPCLFLPSSPPSHASSSAPLSPAPASSPRSAVNLAQPRPPAPNCSTPPLKASRSARIRQPPPPEFRSYPGRSPPPFTPSELTGPNANNRPSPPSSPPDGLPSSRTVSAQLRHRPLSPSTSLSSCSLPHHAPSPPDAWCIDSPPPSPSLNLSSPNQLSFKLQSPSPSLSGSEVKQEKDPEPPTGTVSPLMLMSDSEDDASSRTLGLTPSEENPSDEDQEQRRGGAGGRGCTSAHIETDPAAPIPDPGSGLASEPSAALRVLAQREGTGSDRFCGLEGFLTLGLDLGSARLGPNLAPARTDQDTHHTAQSPLGPLTGSDSWRPSPSSSGNTKDHLVALAMTSAIPSPSQPIQNCVATPTRRRAVSASVYRGGMGEATPRLNRPASSFSRPGSASHLRPLSRAAREIQEICGVDQEDWGDPERLDEDADSLALTRLEEEFRLMAPEPSESTRVQEIKDTALQSRTTVEGQHQRGGPDRVVGEYQSDEEEQTRDQLRDRQTVLSLP